MHYKCTTIFLHNFFSLDFFFIHIKKYKVHKKGQKWKKAGGGGKFAAFAVERSSADKLKTIS